MVDQFSQIKQEIIDDPENRDFTIRKIPPLYYAGPDARINLIAQAPGKRSQDQRMFWNDRSGVRLREWLGVSWDEFYHSGRIAIMPMDFYYPGKGHSGDLPPRAGFAAKWHPRLLKLMPNIQLTILVGAYAAHAYLHLPKKVSQTDIVEHYQQYLPDYWPIIHPSPRNQAWVKHHPWFEEQLLPNLRRRVRQLMNS